MKPFSSNLQAMLVVVLVFFLLWAKSPISGTQTSPSNANAAAPDPALQPPDSCDTSRTVQVTGTSLINVTPDHALIQLGVQSNAATPQAVQQANSAAIQKVLKALQDQGVPAKDIATDVVVIEPVYEDYDSLYIKGYRMNNIVAVTLREVDKTSNLLAAALQAGANQVLNVEFSTSELRKYRDQARELAMQAAREKAQALAQAAGAEAGCVLHINESTWSYYNGWWYGRSQNMWAQNVVQNTAPTGTAGEIGDEPISLGQISVKAEVGVTFSLK